jgi:hypothetical protein
MQLPLEVALRRVLAPLIRLMIARGFRFHALTDLLKDLYVEQAERYFRLGGRRMTDSRISLLTGLQRKDIRRRRAEPDRGDREAPPSMGPLPRILARWAASPRWQDAQGHPLVLQRKAESGPSFEALVTEISRDIHPRTVLDQLSAEGALSHDAATDEVTLVTDTYLARDDAQLLAYLGANLGDHAETAATNLMAEPLPGPFFERAVHYNQLSTDSLEALETLARDIQGDALAELNRAAQAMQENDLGHTDAVGRFRCGVFIYREESPPEETS